MLNATETRCNQVECIRWAMSYQSSYATRESVAALDAVSPATVEASVTPAGLTSNSAGTRQQHSAACVLHLAIADAAAP
jgi:hypothetical protein